MKSLRFNTATFGCKINLYESESIIHSLSLNGMIKEKDIKNSEVVIINTCTVTSKADAKCRNSIRKIRRENHGAIIIVCGCMVNTNYDDLLKMKEIDILVKNEDKDKIKSIIEEYKEQKKHNETYLYKSNRNGCFNHNPSFLSEHSRAFLKIQDGCNNYCSYCKIPYARGKEISKDAFDVFREVEEFNKNGYEEIILSGINLGSYYNNNYNFPKLIKELSQRFSSIRFRLSSIEPQYINKELMQSFKLHNICPHIHIPLQNGSNLILERMNRKYSIEDYQNKIKMVRDNKDDPFISTDLILGFPNETEDDFKRTMDFIKKIKFSFIHLFGYSPRVGTLAFDFKPKVPERIRDERLKETKKIVDLMNMKYRQRYLNKELDVIVERIKGNKYTGKSENYIDMIINSDHKLIKKKRYKVKFDRIENNENYCELVRSEK